jgi:hypothetical protein
MMAALLALVSSVLMYMLLGFASFYVLWILYLAVMNLQRARDAGTITRPAYYLGLPLLYLGLLVDFLVNVFPVTVLFLELPRELLVTARLTRYANGPDGWRKRLALWFAHNLLDTYDPSGQHVHITVTVTPGMAPAAIASAVTAQLATRQQLK